MRPSSCHNCFGTEWAAASWAIRAPTAPIYFCHGRHDHNNFNDQRKGCGRKPENSPHSKGRRKVMPTNRLQNSSLMSTEMLSLLPFGVQSQKQGVVLFTANKTQANKTKSQSCKTEERSIWLCANEGAVETSADSREQLIFTGNIRMSDAEIPKLWRCVCLGYWFSRYLCVAECRWGHGLIHC